MLPEFEAVKMMVWRHKFHQAVMICIVYIAFKVS